jgi:tetraacyldisaccharide 4'-kinase
LKHIKTLSQILLWPLALVYQAVTDLRNYLFDKKMIRSASFDLPVISVGNLSVGGTGKTPHIEYILYLLKYVYRVGTLSRGYGRKSHGFILADRNATARTIGDEPMIFRLKHPEAVVAVGEERVLAIPRMLLEHPDLDVILLDDAYQHRHLKPGLSILLTEYDNLFTRDKVLPAGWLRESAKHYHRADIIIVTKCPADISMADRAKIMDEINPFPYQHVFFSAIAYGDLYALFRDESHQVLLTAGELRRKDVILLTGIANSGKLVKYLEQKANKVYESTYKDHHNFDEYDLENIRETYSNIKSENKVIVTTEKDAVRLWPHRDWFLVNNIPIFVQPIRVRFIENDGAQFDADIIKYIELTRAKRMENSVL